MSLTFANIIAACLYAALGFYLANHVAKQKTPNPSLVLFGTASALLIHALGIISLSIKSDGIQLSLVAITAQIFWAINVIVLLSSIKRPVQNLFILLLPFSAVAVIAAYFSHNQSTVMQLNETLAIHVVLSILAYSLLTIATLQALFLAYQNRQLKNKSDLQRLRFLPPLQTMEALLFEFVTGGEILLTLSILSGFVFLDNLFAQHLAHKTVFSIAAWLVYGFLLIGKYKLGWRGLTAIRWTLAGFLFLMLAYFVNKIVLELILHRM